MDANVSPLRLRPAAPGSGLSQAFSLPGDTAAISISISIMLGRPRLALAQGGLDQRPPQRASPMQRSKGKSSHRGWLRRLAWIGIADAFVYIYVAGALVG